MCKGGPTRGGGLDPLLEKWSVSITDHFWPFFPKWVQPPTPWLDPLYTYGRTDIQTDSDYTKRVVTPFGTTRSWSKVVLVIFVMSISSTMKIETTSAQMFMSLGSRSEMEATLLMHFCSSTTSDHASPAGIVCESLALSGELVHGAPSQRDSTKGNCFYVVEGTQSLFIAWLCLLRACSTAFGSQIDCLTLDRSGGWF